MKKRTIGATVLGLSVLAEPLVLHEPARAAMSTYVANGVFHVPAGVTSIQVDAFGAKGGDAAASALGGAGARVIATLAVTSGEVLDIIVGTVGGTNTNVGGSGGIPGGAPDSFITSEPHGKTKDSTPTFTFASNELGVFECQIDGGGFTPCSSPHTAGRLERNSDHTFSVRAIDAAGNADTSPASETFRVQKKHKKHRG